MRHYFDVKLLIIEMIFCRVRSNFARVGRFFAPFPSIHARVCFIVPRAPYSLSLN